MGSILSSEESTEVVENTGNTNANNVTINHPVQVTHDEHIYLMYILVILAVTQFVMKCYKLKIRNLKRKYKSTVNLINP